MTSSGSVTRHPRLERLGDWPSGARAPSIPRMRRTPSGGRRGRPEALEDVADRSAQIGATLLAAEVRHRGGEAFAADGRPAASAALGLRAASLAEACEGARTPALAVPVMVVPLTPRERDIATLAAQGESSKVIADHLFLSVRTVNNHLQNVYSKLGVYRRRQLAAALAETTELGRT